jgi:histidine ammonia-lyase
MTHTLTPGATTLPSWSVWRRAMPARLDRSARPPSRPRRRWSHKAARGDAPVYGVNTGFGKLASVRIAPEDTETLQRNLILSHCCGVGEPLDPRHDAADDGLKLLSLGRGASGVRWG